MEGLVRLAAKPIAYLGGAVVFLGLVYLGATLRYPMKRLLRGLKLLLRTQMTMRRWRRLYPARKQRKPRKPHWMNK